MTVRESFQTDGAFATLKKLHDIGYRAVEMSQVEMSEANVKEMKTAVDDLGMDICALSTVVENTNPRRRMDSLAEDFDKLLEHAELLGTRYLRIGALPFEYMGKKDKYLEYAEQLNKYGRKLKEHGLKLFYHNHHFEFEKFDGKFALDLLVENTDPEYVGIELDTHWIQRGGQDPIAWIRKLKGRVEIVHLKDYRIAPPKEFTGPQSMAEMVQFAEIGEGNLDFPGIIQACIECGTEYMPIEQDNTYGRDPFDSLRISMENIKKMGFADHF
ncbi:MAG: sugar phosphate isomerase/epimerase [Firmicutes bacterium]|nr:sugar phosphate isomerase/epimerase [Bacillota bacterium]